MAIDGVNVADVEPVPASGRFSRPRGGRGEPLEAAVAGERVAAQVDLGVSQRAGVQFNRHFEFWVQNWVQNWAKFWDNFHMCTRARQV